MKSLNRRSTSRVAIAAAGLLLAGSVASATPAAHASGDDDRVIRTGACSGPGAARWKLKVKTDDGRLEVEGEVDSNRTGQVWAWTVKRDGSVAARGSSRTAGRSGSFSVERTIADGAGKDTVVFTAVRQAGGAREVCSGRIVF